MAETRTYEDFTDWLGAKPHRLGVYTSLFEDLTASHLTESIMNIFTLEKSVNKFQPINNIMFQWEVDVNHIKRVEFAAVPSGNGASGAEVTMAFKENYYQRNDVFRIENSRQLCIVKTAPIKKADNYWEVRVQLIDSDYSKVIDLSYCQIGMKTRFLSNYQSELSIDGYTKYQSNLEVHRNYISCHRNDDSYTTMYAKTEQLFVTLSGKGLDGDKVCKFPESEKAVLDNFLECRNNALVFGKSNFDKNGKCTVTDSVTGLPIWMGKIDYCPLAA